MKQSSIDSVFLLKLSGDSYEVRNYYDDVLKIREVVKARHGIELSSAEAAYFWSWHSLDWDASWLMFGPKAEDEISNFFADFYAKHAAGYDEDEIEDVAD